MSEWRRAVTYWRKRTLPEWWATHWPYAVIRTQREQIATLLRTVEYWKREAG